MEIWKDVVEYKNQYKVSNFGKVKSLPKLRCKKEKILKPNLSSEYKRVVLYKNNKRKEFLIHRLVCEAFNGKCPNGKSIVNHKNGIKKDNRPENLEWSTPKDNANHSIKILGNRIDGTNNGNSIFNKFQVNWIRKYHNPNNKDFSSVAISKITGLSRYSIMRIINNLTYQDV